MQPLCGASALARWGFAPAKGQPFAALGASRAVLEVDGFGYQASLMSKLTLGSPLIAPTSLFPLWYDGLLEDEVHLLRVRPDASDLPRALRWLATHGATAGLGLG